MLDLSYVYPGWNVYLLACLRVYMHVLCCIWFDSLGQIAGPETRGQRQQKYRQTVPMQVIHATRADEQAAQSRAYGLACVHGRCVQRH